MTAQPVFYGPWHILVKVKHVLCPDGKRRTAVCVGQPDTYFSQPARVKAYGKTVSGFITGIETDGQQDYAFHAYTYRKNGSVFNQD